MQALLVEASRLRDSDVAEGIEEIVWSMQGHVDRELARARLTAESGASGNDVRAAAQAVFAVLQRSPRGEEIDFAAEAPLA